MTARVNPLSPASSSDPPRQNRRRSKPLFSQARVIQTLEAHSSKVVSLAWSPSGLYLATAAQNGEIRMYLVLKDRGGFVRPNPIRTFRAHGSAVLHMTFSRGDFLLSASMDRSVRLWHVDTELCLRRFSHVDMVPAVAFHPNDENCVVSGGCDGVVRVWRPSDHACVAEREVGGVVTAIEFVNGGGFLFVGTYDGRVVVLEIKEEEKTELKLRRTVQVGRRRRKIGVRVEGIVNDARTGEMVVSCSDGRVHMMKGEHMEVGMRVRAVGKKEPRAVAVGGSLSHDGRFLLYDAVGGVVRVLDVGQARVVEAGLKGRKKEREIGISLEALTVGASVSCAAFATEKVMSVALPKREGNDLPVLVAVGGDDGTVRLVYDSCRSVDT